MKHEGWVIVNRHDEYFSGWHSACSISPGGSESYYPVPGWTKNPEFARVYPSERAAKRAAEWKRPRGGLIIGRSMGEVAIVGGVLELEAA